MYLRSGDLNFRRRRRDNWSRVAVYFVLIVAALWLVRQGQQGEIASPFEPTPTATRTALSFAEEAERQFSAGRLPAAVEAYVAATNSDPTNVAYWIALARVQIYAGQADEAVKSAETAVLLDPENSNAHAVHAFALDWAGDSSAAADAAVRAIGLDGNNALAHAYYAEALIDQGRFAQAGDSIRLALSLAPNSMDVRRIYGYFLEAAGAYEEAIQQYQAAATINPNLPFLYIRLGLNYRVLNQYEYAIESFQRAAALDPTDVDPLLSIARTYLQIGEFGRAAQYLEAAMEIEPTNGGIYARRGMVFVRSLNYEGALIDLSCAIDGCAEHPETGAAIEALELNNANLEYYYSYASLLAAYLRCDEALPLLDRLRPYGQTNEVVAGIIAENETICANAGSTSSTAPVEVNVTPNADSDEGGLTLAPTGNPNAVLSAPATVTPTPFLSATAAFPTATTGP